MHKLYHDFTATSDATYIFEIEGNIDIEVYIFNRYDYLGSHLVHRTNSSENRKISLFYKLDKGNKILLRIEDKYQVNGSCTIKIYKCSHDYQYQYYNAAKHTGVCTICGDLIYHPHFIYASDVGKKVAICVECNALLNLDKDKGFIIYSLPGDTSSSIIPLNVEMDLSALKKEGEEEYV